MNTGTSKLLVIKTYTNTYILHCPFSDYISRLRTDGHGGSGPDGVLDMPDDLKPEAVAAIVRFMYTGRLEVRPGSFDALYDAATKMRMNVLTKLMDAQLAGLSPGSSTPTKKSPVKRKRNVNDPIRQMKKIKRIEKQFTEEGKRVQCQQIKRENLADFGENILPGKKLPIWKKRSTGQQHTALKESPPKTSPSPTSGNEQAIVLTPVAGPPPGSRLVPVSEPCIVKTSLIHSSSSPAHLKESTKSQSGSAVAERKRSTSPELRTPVTSKAYSRGAENLRRGSAETKEGKFDMVRKPREAVPSAGHDANPDIFGGDETKDMSVEEVNCQRH